MTTLAAVGCLVASLMTAKPSPAPSLDEVAARHLEALGGAARLRAVRSLRRTGVVTLTVDGNPQNGTFAVEAKRPHKVRTEMSVGGSEALDVFDGTSGWTLDEETGQTRRMNEEEVREKLAPSQLDPWLLDFKERGITVVDLGAAEVGSVPVRKLKVSFRGLSSHLYLDARTWLEVRSERLDETGAVRYSTVVRGHTTVKGLKFPESIEVAYERVPARMSVRFEKTEIDPDIPDSRFAGPK
jgi:outer membrane lipoprotein-sorting protein